MVDEGRFLVDVGMKGLPFPMRVLSKSDPEGQHTVAEISITARIMQHFEAQWINKFIQIVHQHRERIGTKTLRTNIVDYMEELQAASVEIEFSYPFFLEKSTPVSHQSCLVRYLCRYTVRMHSLQETPKVRFSIEVPMITTFPGSALDKPGGLFGQLSVALIEVETQQDICPEELVEIVDRHALSPIYSFLPGEDQIHIIQKVHTEAKSSVTVTDGIKSELARRTSVEWYSVRCTNFGMLHSYSTVISTEKSAWVPFSGYYSDEI